MSDPQSLARVRARTEARKAAGLIPVYRIAPRKAAVKATGRPVRLSLACVHMAGPTGERRPCQSCAGETLLDVMRCSLHGGCTPGKRVSGVRFCGDCDDLRLAVPEPPSLDLRPESDRAVVTVACGKEGRALLEISRPWLARYAARLGADFVILDWVGHPVWPMAGKFRIHRALDHYDRIAYLDADTLGDPDRVPSLFDLVPPGRFGAYDDLPGVTAKGRHRGFVAEYAKVCRGQGLAVGDPRWYCNTGVFVAGREFRDVLRGPEYPIQPFHCSEQHVFIGRLQHVEPYFLPAACNFQWWEQGEAAMWAAPAENLLHFSGMIPDKSFAERLSIMRQFAQKLGV